MGRGDRTAAHPGAHRAYVGGGRQRQWMRWFPSLVITWAGQKLSDRPSSSPSEASPRLLLNRKLHGVAPLCPRPVIVPHVRRAQQMGQDKPGMAAALADAAVGNYIVGRLDPLLFLINSPQFLGALKGPVRVGRARPGHVARARDMAAA